MWVQCSGREWREGLRSILECWALRQVSVEVLGLGLLPIVGRWIEDECISIEFVVWYRLSFEGCAEVMLLGFHWLGSGEEVQESMFEDSL